MDVYYDVALPSNVRTKSQIAGRLYVTTIGSTALYRMHMRVERAHQVHQHALEVDGPRGQMSRPEQKDGPSCAEVSAATRNQKHTKDPTFRRFSVMEERRAAPVDGEGQ